MTVVCILTITSVYSLHIAVGISQELWGGGGGETTCFCFPNCSDIIQTLNNIITYMI